MCATYLYISVCVVVGRRSRDSRRLFKSLLSLFTRNNIINLFNWANKLVNFLPRYVFPLLFRYYAHIYKTFTFVVLIFLNTPSSVVVDTSSDTCPLEYNGNIVVWLDPLPHTKKNVISLSGHN